MMDHLSQNEVISQTKRPHNSLIMVLKKKLTVPGEYMSPVRNPLFSVSVTAASILFAAFSSPKPYRNSIAALRIVANGLALSCNQNITGGEANFRQTKLEPIYGQNFSK